MNCTEAKGLAQGHITESDRQDKKQGLRTPSQDPHYLILCFPEKGTQEKGNPGTSPTHSQNLARPSSTRADLPGLVPTIVRLRSFRVWLASGSHERSLFWLLGTCPEDGTASQAMTPALTQLPTVLSPRGSRTLRALGRSAFLLGFFGKRRGPAVSQQACLSGQDGRLWGAAGGTDTRGCRPGCKSNKAEGPKAFLCSPNWGAASARSPKTSGATAWLLGGLFPYKPLLLSLQGWGPGTCLFKEAGVGAPGPSRSPI